MQTGVIDQILKPVVRIRTNKGRGSGTVIKSSEGGTYLLTNYHVIESCLEYKDVWDELLRRNVKKEFTSAVELDFSKINHHGAVKGLITSVADIILSNKQHDLALLKVRDEETFPSAMLYPEESAAKVPMLASLACCGAAMGEKPIVTYGNLNGIQIEIDNYEYYLSSAPSIFGNSGGAVFTPYEDHWAYFGIPSRITVAILGFAADAITHMGYFIPITRIYQWLRDNCYEYLWDISVTKEQCDQRREVKRERELALSLIRERG